MSRTSKARGVYFAVVRQPKRKLNLTIKPEVRLKLDQMAEIENRSVSNLVEVMANERWNRLSKAIGSR